MKKAILGKKIGMTQIFDEKGKVIPVTAIEAGPCTVVQIKTKDFKIFSHQKKMDMATNSTKIIYDEAKKLLKELYKGVPIRLIGIRVDGLSHKDEIQLSIFDNNKNDKQEKIDAVIDKIKDKYGYNAITRAGKGNLKETPDKLK